jgi:hypothetical protein
MDGQIGCEEFKPIKEGVLIKTPPKSGQKRKRKRLNQDPHLGLVEK